MVSTDFIALASLVEASTSAIEVQLFCIMYFHSRIIVI
jgi:hypothetical protein